MKTIKRWLAWPGEVIALLKSIDERLSALQGCISKGRENGTYPTFRTGANRYDY